MKDKELRNITYNSFSELNRKVDYLYNYLIKGDQSQHDPFKRFLSTVALEDGSPPNERINWKDLRKCGKCKVE